MKVPPKVRQFGWQCGRGILPIKIVLAQRGVLLTTGCDFYGEQESILHALIDCSHAKLAWRFKGLNISSVGLNIMMVAWSIWGGRNNFRWNQLQEYPYTRVTGAVRLKIDWNSSST